MTDKIRTFESGATRDTDVGKHDYRGYLSPAVLRRFGEYMTAHRVQSDGSLRASDNWKKGMPVQEYLSSLLRHVVDIWLLHEGRPGVATQDIEEALCGALFNIQGYLHEHLKGGTPERRDEGMSKYPAGFTSPVIGEAGPYAIYAEF